jgi:FdhD protein
VVDVTLAGDAGRRAQGVLSRRRLVTANSSCGVCGRRTIDDLMTDVASIPHEWTVRAEVIGSLASALRRVQPVFEETGGLHAAALFDREGRLIASAEDVGRHNAVDKVIGRELLMDNLPLGDRLLFVSGRASYEIVQKALVAGIPLLASVSAPSTLAVDLARRAGLTLLGFVRGDTFNAYSGEDRLQIANHESRITNH